MNENDKALADRIEAEFKEREKREPLSLAGYMEIDFAGESYPLNDDGINALPEDVVYGDREATEYEKREALKAQGYTLE